MTDQDKTALLSKLRAPVADERAAQQPQTGNQYHLLKTDPEVFQAVLSGAKTFEIRLNDRGYVVGDVLGLRETKHTGAEMRAGAPLVYTGRECQRFVSHVLTGYGLADGWCCLSFKLPHAGGASAPVAEEGVRTEALYLLREARALLPLFTTAESIGDWSEKVERFAAGHVIDVPASAPVAGEAQPVAEVVSRYGDPEAFGERDLKVLVDLNSYPYGAKFYAAPQASEAVYTSEMGEAAQSYLDSFPYAHKLPAQFRWADLWNVMHNATSRVSESFSKEDVSTVLNFIFDRFGAPCKAGDLPGYVVAALRRLEHAALSAQPGAQKNGGSDA